MVSISTVDKSPDASHNPNATKPDPAGFDRALAASKASAQIDGNAARKDDLTGGGGDDLLGGGEGDDVISGGGGDDYLTGGKGNDVISGGAGDDWLFAGGGVNKLDGGAGDDTYELIGGDNVIDDKDGTNSLIINAGKDRTAADISARRDGDDLVIDVAGRGTTRVKDHFGEGRMDTIHVNDFSMTPFSGEGIKRLADIVTHGDGDNQIDVDTVKEQKKGTLFTVEGAGSAIIFDDGGVDGIDFAKGKVADTQMTQEGDDLIVKNGDAEVTIKDHFTSGKVETISFQDGKLFDFTEDSFRLQADSDFEDRKDIEVTIEPKVSGKGEIKDGEASFEFSVGVETGVSVDLGGVFDAISDFFGGIFGGDDGGGGGGDNGVTEAEEREFGGPAEDFEGSNGLL